MKKLLLFLIIGMFMISFVSAFEFDNKKIFKKDGLKYGKIELKNAFGFGSKLADYTLEKNTDQCLINCFAEGTATLYKKDKLFSDLKFKGRDNSFKNVKSNKILIRANESYQVKINEYYYYNTTSKNGTITQKSDIVATYYETKYKEVWQDYNFKNLEIGTYSWRIEAKKNKGESIDWIGTAFGKDLTDWAWWNNDWKKKRNITGLTGNISYLNISYDADMNTDFSDLRFLDSAETIEFNYTIESEVDSTYAIVRVNNLGGELIYMYYDNSVAATNENASDTYFVPVSIYYLDNNNLNDALGKYNLTNSGTVNTSGIISDGRDFTADIDYLEATSIPAFRQSQSFSWSLWIKWDRLTGDKNFISSGKGNNAFTTGNFRSGTSVKFQTQNNAVGSTVTIAGGTVSTGTWYHIVYTYDGSSKAMKGYLNGVSIANGTAGASDVVGSNGLVLGGFYISSTLTTQLDGQMDEVYIYNNTVLTTSQIIALYNQTAPSYILGAEELNVPNVTLNTPLDTEILTNQTVVFNGSVFSANTILNVSLILDGIYNETNTSGVSNTDYLFTKIVSDGSHNWTYESCDTSGCESAIVRTFSVDTISPTINITSPTGVLNYNIVGQNETLNITFTDTNLDTCWYNYNGTNITIPGCLTGVLNSTNFILETGNTNITAYANDTSGNENSSFSDWDYYVFQNNQTYNTNTTEGAIETFSINFSANEIPTSVSFIYNGTITIADIDATDFPIVIASESITIPGISSTTIFQFFWNIVSSSSNLNTTATNQTVSNISVDDCSSFSNVLYNYSMVDEATQVIIPGSAENVSLEIDLSIYNADKSLLVLNYINSFSGTNPNAVCSENNLFNGSTYIIDSTIKYSSAAREIEYYNIRDSTINNQSITQNITLYDIKTSESTVFQITFKNSDFVIVANALIQVNRQYVSEGVFKTVELPITDSNGQTVVHLVKNDVVYNYIVTKNGATLGTFNNLIAFCEDETIGQCFISLNALEGVTPVFNPDTDIGITSSFSFNDTTRDLTFTFSTNDGSVKTILVDAILMDQIGNTSVCSTSLTSSSGTLTCNVPASLGNETIIVSVFIDGKLSLTKYFQAANDIILGDSGYFLLLFLIISLALMFSESKSMTIGGVMLGFIAGGLLFFIKGGIVGGGSAVMWLIIMGVILIWKLNSDGQT